ncbi:XRE family transcriptional regulator [Paenibacillus sp. GD4]|jgi:transcriptional regulator with XRE-family HTH domain|uniref:helix-turn-helix domain-containing protein n=1 Tax=Paenibacillus sp. GD4 TaxID=3068890 RepID=UPI0027965643|nr:XRE family transcriptional regulator [Paenibacillus sp. GD4]MDQ1913439.1 XRE family transcriptional regulator [Paenibacillus sp. GD4]
MELGKRIKYFRKSQRRTLNEIAQVCGFTNSLLSKIENGKTTPPISTLVKIANALGVRVSDLLGENEQVGTVLTKKDAIEGNLISTNKGYSFYTFAPELKDKLMQPFLFHARKDEIKQHVFSHTGHEFVYMLEGQMRYKVGAVEYTLLPGDSVYFNSLEEHTLVPITEEVKYLAVFADTGETHPENREEE